MKSKLAIFITGCILIGTLAIYASGLFKKSGALGNLLEIGQRQQNVNEELLGYTKYTDYLKSSKKVISEQMLFLAAKVSREYTLVEHIQTKKLLLTSEATVIVTYSVDYSFGFDLKPENFEIFETSSGIEVQLYKPMLISMPAVTPLSYEIASKGFLVDEKGAVIEIQQKLPEKARKLGEEMASEDDVKALCEKKLIQFFRDYLSKQPGVKKVPSISVLYKQS